jgi:death-on-curing protein
VIDYLDLDDVLAAADAAVGGKAQVRDLGLLESALARPRATVYGDDAYRSLDDKAAALLHSLVTSHPLVDGNKRLGWVAARLFYQLNDADLDAPAEAAFDLVVGIAAGRADDVASIARQLAGWRRSPGTVTTHHDESELEGGR